MLIFTIINRSTDNICVHAHYVLADKFVSVHVIHLYIKCLVIGNSKCNNTNNKARNISIEIK